jgi:hypothetical protein
LRSLLSAPTTLIRGHAAAPALPRHAAAVAPRPAKNKEEEEAIMVVATLLLIGMFLCAIYLTVDRIIEEVRRDKENKRELEDWNAEPPPPKQYEPTRKNKKRA